MAIKETWNNIRFVELMKTDILEAYKYRKATLGIETPEAIIEKYWKDKKKAEKQVKPSSLSSEWSNLPSKKSDEVLSTQTENKLVSVNAKNSELDIDNMKFPELVKKAKELWIKVFWVKKIKLIEDIKKAI